MFFRNLLFSAANLSRHERQRHKKDVIQIHCPGIHCKKIFENRRGIANHITAKHPLRSSDSSDDTDDDELESEGGEESKGKSHRWEEDRSPRTHSNAIPSPPHRNFRKTPRIHHHHHRGHSKDIGDHLMVNTVRRVSTPHFRR